MKQGKRKNAAADTSAPSDDAAPALPDAAYVDQLLAGNAPATATETVAQAAAEVSAAGVIDLPAQCLLRDAVEYQQRLLKCVDIASVEIDVGAVQRIDTAFVQVLLAFARSRNEANQAIVWRHVNPVFAEAVCLLGLRSALAVPDASEAA